jgi:hypothetical protein
MVRILANGDVVPDDDPRARAAVANTRFFDTVMNNKLFLGVALVTLFLIVRKPVDPFADGPVPAATRPPSEHWEAIQRQLTFVRDFTDYMPTAPARAARG